MKTPDALIITTLVLAVLALIAYLIDSRTNKLNN
jgi:hypothetical protein